MTINIPEQIKHLNFVLNGGNGKQPIEKAWQKKIHRLNDPIFQKHINSEKNYGVQINNSFININGNSYFLIVVDFDNKEFQDKIISNLPETFTTTSGSSKQCVHLWFASNNNKAFKIKDNKLETLADVLGEGNQVIAPGSKHKSGCVYSIIKDIPISFINYAELEAILKPYDKSPKKSEKIKKQYIPKGISQDISSKILDSVSIKEVLEELKVDTSKNPTNCPFHSSAGGKCLGFDDNTIHCFHCGDSWNKYSILRQAKNLTDKETFEWFAEKSGMINELKKSRKEYLENQNPIKILTDKNFQAQKFIELQPLFYDKSGCWWMWNKEKYKWCLVDEIDILNMMQDNGHNTIPSKERTEILNALKQHGRRNTPKPVKNTWIQFYDEIFDVVSGEKFKVTSDYFVTNPIPYKLHPNKLEVTPTMDKIFEEWVGKDNVKLLYQIISYSILPDYPLHRLFCFVGPGMNGKGCFLRLIEKFIGKDNLTSTELDTLLNSRFEITKLHKKLVCIMGETNFNELSKTSILKKLTGQDLIGFEYKNKLPFDDYNYAKILIATNNLPTTTDKTIGFYRRWMIIDFPNQFSEQKDILKNIPEEEFQSLSLKCCYILHDLLKQRKFHNEGDIEERMERYESRSDFMQKFLDMFTEKNMESYITAADFIKKFHGWCKENKLRIMAENTIGMEMKKKGYEKSRKYFNWLFDGKGGQIYVFYGLKWKN